MPKVLAVLEGNLSKYTIYSLLSSLLREQWTLCFRCDPAFKVSIRRISVQDLDGGCRPLSEYLSDGLLEALDEGDEEDPLIGGAVLGAGGGRGPVQMMTG